MKYRIRIYNWHGTGSVMREYSSEIDVNLLSRYYSDDGLYTYVVEAVTDNIIIPLSIYEEGY